MAAPPASSQRFAVLALVYPAANARWGSGLSRRRSQRVMVADERAAIMAVIEGLPATVADWSDGLAAMEPFDVVVVRRPLTSLSSSGGGRWWVGPRDCRPEIGELALGGRYDSILVLWPSDGEVPLCGWGCTIGPSDAAAGAGFTSIASDHWPSLATNPDPAQGYVHEWLHQVESIYRALGVGEDLLPGLHDAGAFTSCRPGTEPPFGRTYAEHHDGVPGGLPGAETWSPWYRDWMTGRLRPVGTDSGAPCPELGLTPERWATRSNSR